jgi:hypothetical protein
MSAITIDASRQMTRMVIATIQLRGTAHRVRAWP